MTAERPSRAQSFTNSFGLEVERLLKKLPGADPGAHHVREGSSAPRPSAVAPGRPARPLIGNSSSDSAVAAWLKVVAALTLAVAVFFWPYAHACGGGLYAYVGVVAMVLISGAWASWSAWRWRLGLAHLVGLVVVFWGTVLAAEVLLPRIGYAAIEAAWRCPS